MGKFLQFLPVRSLRHERALTSLLDPPEQQRDGWHSFTWRWFKDEGLLVISAGECAFQRRGRRSGMVDCALRPSQAAARCEWFFEKAPGICVHSHKTCRKGGELHEVRSGVRGRSVLGNEVGGSSRSQQPDSRLAPVWDGPVGPGAGERRLGGVVAPATMRTSREVQEKCRISGIPFTKGTQLLIRTMLKEELARRGGTRRIPRSGEFGTVETETSSAASGKSSLHQGDLPLM